MCVDKCEDLSPLILSNGNTCHETVFSWKYNTRIFSYTEYAIMRIGFCYARRLLEWYQNCLY